mmetsp:Transcript_43948/g.78957  ORF Transcript_43948/g.78957 Transcript_43948/m.78957 type:complete len:125 (+) Transcript_43948:301-675(+)
MVATSAYLLPVRCTTHTREYCVVFQGSCPEQAYTNSKHAPTRTHTPTPKCTHTQTHTHTHTHVQTQTHNGDGLLTVIQLHAGRLDVVKKIALNHKYLSSEKQTERKVTHTHTHVHAHTHAVHTT